MNNHKRIACAFLFLVIVCVCGALLCLKVIYDNKYTLPPLPIRSGQPSLTAADLNRQPLYFLIDGWEYYQYKFLCPQELDEGGIQPDATVFIGQYGGFELEGAGSSPHGCGTWRKRIRIDGTAESPKLYALDMTEIPSDFCLWINGKLMVRSAGKPFVPYPGDAGGPRDLPAFSHSGADLVRPSIDAGRGSIVIFQAADMIEIVVAARDDTHFYSGFTYPPALGAPEAVIGLQKLRLFIAAFLCAGALLTSLLYLTVGLRVGLGKSACLYGMLCLCCILTRASLTVSLLLGHALETQEIERIGLYGALSLILILQQRLCGLPSVICRLTVSVGVSMCLWSFLFPRFFMGDDLSSMILFSRTFTLYKWAVCAALFLGPLWVLRPCRTLKTLWPFSSPQTSQPPGSPDLLWPQRNRLPVDGSYSSPDSSDRLNPWKITILMSGSLVFCMALLIDRSFTMYEPIILTWPAETAIYIQTFLCFAVLISDTVEVYHNSVQAMEREQIALYLARVRTERCEELTNYSRDLRRIKHETRSGLLRFRHLCRTGQNEKLMTAIDKELDSIPEGRFFCANELVNSILSAQLFRANDWGVAANFDVSSLPPSLPFDEGDLCALLVNLLDNAIEGAVSAGAAAAEKKDPHLTFSMRIDDSYLSVHCVNSAPSVGEDLPTTKKDRCAHGFGIPLIRKITDKYEGLFSVRYNGDLKLFEARILLPLQG